ncbi:hypothetical protein, partial [Paenibacillus apis]|uniref:hypothetical protein n=1 Tax=Paenibacillus apis TaxID=1792174 RepID=UPI002659C47B
MEKKRKRENGQPFFRFLFFCQKKTIRYAYGSGELPAMYQKNSSRCYNKFGSPTEFIEQQE